MSTEVQQTTIAELQEIGALGWPGTEVDRLGSWLLRASGGFTGRANSALPLGSPGLPMPDAVAHVRRWYADRELPPRFMLPMPLAAEIDDHLDRDGWRVSDAATVLVAELEPLAWPAVGEEEVHIAPRPDDAWLGAYHYRGRPLPAYARAVVEAGRTLAFASVREPDGRVLAIARGAVDRGWLGVTAVEVVPEARRRGLATLVLRALAGWALRQGARSCYLQVAVENHAALALYRGAGFAVHHGYHYRVAP